MSKVSGYSHPEESFEIAVLQYFDCFYRKIYVMECIFSKAAKAALLKMYSIADLLIRGMIRRTALL